jgi:hypothetical protein
MKTQIFAFIFASITPAVASLGYAWRAHLKNLPEPKSSEWRTRILTIAVFLATLSQLLVTGFLLQGFHGDRQSFVERVSLPWAIANWVTLLGWTFAVVAAAIGQGSAKRPLIFWVLIAPISAWFVVQMGWNY